MRQGVSIAPRGIVSLRRLALTFALFVAALAHAGCGGGGGGGTGAAAVATGTETASISGTVRDYATGNPVAGATVSLSAGDAAPALAPAFGAPARAVSATVTDAAGFYRFAGVVPGTYYVNVTSPDGQSAIYPAVARAGEEVTASPELTPVARVSGTVRVPSGTAGPVRVSIPGTGFLALAEPSGDAAAFAFEGVPIRRDADPAYLLKASCAGLATTSAPFTLRLAEVSGAAAFAKALPDVTLAPAIPNRPPVILSAVPDRGSYAASTANPASVLLTATVSDADGDTVTVRWVQVEGPAATPGQAGGAAVTVSVSTEGAYRFLATATDQLGFVSDPVVAAFTVIAP